MPETNAIPDPTAAPESRGAFGGFIGPKTLLGLVRNTAPYLFDAPPPPAATGDQDPLRWWRILLRSGDLTAASEPTPPQWTAYFELCVAAHFATVATYVPTDVDTKIRDHFWFLDQPADERARMRDFVLAVEAWDMRKVSTRIVDLGELGVHSGHHGERLSILSGGMLGMLRAGDADGAAVFEERIEAELAR